MESDDSVANLKRQVTILQGFEGEVGSNASGGGAGNMNGL